MKKILFAGESWTTYTTHVKGFDVMSTAAYEEGGWCLIKALQNAGFDVDYMPSHVAAFKFPMSVDELKAYDCVILSDIGSSTLLLHPDTFTKSKRLPNRCDVIRDYVAAGGALLMVGGYMSFSGIQAKAKYGHTSLDSILPVHCLLTDDLMEHPEGAEPVVASQHPVLKGLPPEIPALLGYNKTTAKDSAEIVLTICGDPLLAFARYGQGRTGVFTSDCAPHWAPPEFVGWAGYEPFFKAIIDYMTA